MPIELWKIFPNVGKPQGNSFFSTIKNRSFLYLIGYKKDRNLTTLKSRFRFLSILSGRRFFRISFNGGPEGGIFRPFLSCHHLLYVGMWQPSE